MANFAYEFVEFALELHHMVKAMNKILMLAAAIRIFTMPTDIQAQTDKPACGYNPIVAAVDSLMVLQYISAGEFSVDTAKIRELGYEEGQVPEFPDLVYEYRIGSMNSQSPVPFVYNKHVRAYIDVYTVRKRDQLSRMLGLAELYFPIFERYLDLYNLPLELKYIAIIESALNPLAVSRSGATGLWQFMYNSSRMFDLEVNSYMDERRDPVQATIAACKYLQYLYRVFGDWQLVIASYNGGPGKVRNAIIRSGGKTSFWEIRPYLPLETQNYVPAFMGAAYAMQYHYEHNVLPEKPRYYFHQTDYVMVERDLPLAHVSKVLGIPMEVLRYLNPVYKKDHIPYDGEPMRLVLPTEMVSPFIKNEKQIYEYKEPSADFHSIQQGAGSTKGRVKIIHNVNPGDFFHRLAVDYNCTVDDILVWNNIRKQDGLLVGQKIIIWVPENQAHIYDNEKAKKPEQITMTQTSFVMYTVEAGDTLSSIARKFDGTTVEDIIHTNDGKIDKMGNIKPGQSLKIPINP